MPRSDALNLEAVIFDVDGTLAETEELHRWAFNKAFQAAGLDWHWDQALYADLLAVTGGKERIGHFLRLANTSMDDSAVAALHAAKTRHYGARVAEGGLALRPGILRLMAEARSSGVRLAIATTTSRPNIEALLAACAPVPPIDVIAAGDEVAAKKPAPDVYHLALQRLGLPAARCVAVEDTLNGLRSATGANLRCVVTVSAYGGAGPFPGAACVLSDLGEPGAPCTVLAGPPPAGGIADLAYLDALPQGT